MSSTKEDIEIIDDEHSKYPEGIGYSKSTFDDFECGASSSNSSFEVPVDKANITLKCKTDFSPFKFANINK
jgi:hypothetical protein